MKLMSLLILILLVLLSACGSNDTNPNEPAPTLVGTGDPADYELVLTEMLPDAAGDQIAMPPEAAGPDYSGPVIYPPVDVTGVRLGVDGDWLYMRVDFHGQIPPARVSIAAEGEIESQIVGGQGMNIAMNTDGDIQTGGGGEGVSGIDIFFAVGFDYGREVNIYANYDFPDGDLHHNQQQLLGELLAGGSGHQYVIVRYNVSNLGVFFPRGSQVDLGGWSEAESFNADGSLKYHHFAFDELYSGSWDIPTL